MDNAERKMKATWEEDILHIFCDICIKAVRAGLRPRTHFNRDGWKMVVKEFELQTGRDYDKYQLKNKWDQLKKEWKMRKNLIGNETALRWDPKKRTVAASREWWEEKLKGLPPIASKFRTAGLEPELFQKLDIMFASCTVKGASGLAPSSSTVHVDDKESRKDVKVEIRIGDSDSEGDNSLENVADASTPVPNATQATQHTTSTFSTMSPKRKNEEFQNHDRKGKIVAVEDSKEDDASELIKRMDHLIDLVESKSVANHSRIDPPGCSIAEVVDLLYAIPEIEVGGELFMFATRLFMVREKREMFAALKHPHVRVTWLRNELLRPTNV